mgnify:CR=1 FL=1
MTMTARERVMCALSGDQPDRVPFCEGNIAANVARALAGSDRDLSEREISELTGRDVVVPILFPPYFADTALEYALGEFTRRGIPLSVSVAIAGGASLLAGSGQDEVGSALVNQVKDILAGRKLSVKLENIGGTRLRTMILNIDEGKIKIS